MLETLTDSVRALCLLTPLFLALESLIPTKAGRNWLRLLFSLMEFGLLCGPLLAALQKL